MPKKKDALNLGQEGDAAKKANTKEKGSMKKIIIIAVVVLLLGGGAGAYFLLGGSDSAEVVGEEGVEQIVEEEEEKTPIYLALNPAFVVNFEHNGGIRYLQLTLQVMSYEQGVIDKVELNMPAVRNNLIMLFSGQDFDYLNTVEGKESLRKDVIKSIHTVVRPKGSAKLQDAYFTGFVMQ